ncbi:hypothetical protein BW731_07560 [Vagococcus martis]|uniref:TcdA-E operon negative regulator n=1 Tax=Vagococcus martis TaxID=1768210 RepID=A0A1V4DHS8_9ENTE|nr:hypothetical protein [Vagococcus martis]OPF88039.1 hypothetical protein BW731_07560 [Vagococcus martis]
MEKENVGYKIKEMMRTEWFLIISLIVFFPLGLFLLWKNNRYGKKTKVALSIILPLKFIWFILMWIFLIRIIDVNQQLREQIRFAYGDIDKQKSLYYDYKEKMSPYEQLADADLEKQQKNVEIAQKVSNQLSTLPSVTLISLEHKEKVELAKKAYEQLNDEQKAYVDGTVINELSDKIKELEDKAKKEEDERKKQKEEQDKRAKEKAEEDAKGYDTGITYQQLARTPDDYMMKKVKFSGKVVQVLENDKDTQLRIAVDGNHDTIVYAEYESKLVSSRVLEDDYITISGYSMGLLSYKSTIGGTITIPSIVVKKVEQ